MYGGPLWGCPAHLWVRHRVGYLKHSTSRGSVAARKCCCGHTCKGYSTCISMLKRRTNSRCKQVSLGGS